MKKGQLRYGLLVVLSLFASCASSAEITVAVASNFTHTIKILVDCFEDETGAEVRVVSGSSGKLYAQISHGAPFDIFLSADQTKPEVLVASEEVVADSQFTYAVGALALWSARTSLIDGKGNILKHGEFHKLALANPKLAPYGKAAVEVLKNLGLADETRGKWVQGENISQTYQFVATGNADLGFVALSQLKGDKSRPEGSTWVVPKHLYSPIRQDAVLLKRGDTNETARAFMTFLRSEKARRVIGSTDYNVNQQ